MTQFTECVLGQDTTKHFKYLNALNSGYSLMRRDDCLYLCRWKIGGLEYNLKGLGGVHPTSEWLS